MVYRVKLWEIPDATEFGELLVDKGLITYEHIIPPSETNLRVLYKIRITQHGNEELLRSLENMILVRTNPI